MKGSIFRQEVFYRRGLVLGFTMAEILVLIIFSLLLALSLSLAQREKEIKKLNEKIAGFQKKANDLHEEN